MSKPIFKLVKNLLTLFPPSFPFRIYNILLTIPFLKGPMSRTILWLSPRSLDIEEGKIIFDKDDPVMSGALGLGEYEPGTMALFRSYLKEGMTVIDIGANLGYFTVIAARRVGPQGLVLCYEPDPHNFSLLEKNIAANGFTNVKPFTLALSDKSGTRELFFGDNQTTLSFSDKKGEGRFESVATDTLDNSLKALGSPKVDMIKMDIEGAEPIALDGMLGTIARNPDIIVLFEFHPNAIKRLDYSPLRFLERWKELGFSLSAIDEDRKTETSIDDTLKFEESFNGKELSMNLVAVKCSSEK